MTHTPGPWNVVHDSINSWYIEGADESVVADFSAHDICSDKHEPENMADIHLILAAPDMLAALKAAREAISTLDVDALGVATCDYNGAPCQYPIRDELLDNLNKAIAKAEGGHE